MLMPSLRRPRALGPNVETTLPSTGQMKPRSLESGGDGSGCAIAGRLATIGPSSAPGETGAAPGWVPAGGMDRRWPA